jgi:hypothetical protein
VLKEILGFLCGVLFAWFVFGRIALKAGYPRWYGLLMMIPIANVVLMIWFAFTRWPLENDLLDARLAGPPVMRADPHSQNREI